MNYRPSDPYTNFGASVLSGGAADATYVNGVLLIPAATGTGVQVAAVGDDTNIDIALTPKGTGSTGVTTTLTAASYAASAVQNQFLSKLTLTPATTVTAANGLNAARGEVNLTTGKTLGDGTASYVAGVYGRANIFGTVNIASGDLAAVMGKMDLNGSTLTSGHIASVQANIVNPPASASSTGAVALFYGESASGTKINAGLELYMASNFAFVMTDVNTSNFLPAISSTTLNGLNIKVQLNGTTYYIPTKTAA